MKYTIINTDRAPVISQAYDTIEEARARLDAINAKAPGVYSFTIAGVDADGEISDVDGDGDPKPAPRNPSRSGPARRH